LNPASAGFFVFCCSLPFSTLLPFPDIPSSRCRILATCNALKNNRLLIVKDFCLLLETHKRCDRAVSGDKTRLKDKISFYLKMLRDVKVLSVNLARYVQ